MDRCDELAIRSIFRIGHTVCAHDAVRPGSHAEVAIIQGTPRPRALRGLHPALRAMTGDGGRHCPVPDPISLSPLLYAL